MTKREQEFEAVITKTLQEIQDLFLVKGKEAAARTREGNLNEILAKNA